MLRRNLAIVMAVSTAFAVSASAGLVNTVTDTTAGGATADGTVNGGEYVGTVSGGGTSFGGPVGNGTLSVDSDADSVQLGFSGMGDISGNAIRIYFDTKVGGFADNSGFNDTADFGRERLSNVGNSLTFPFPADYGMILSPAFGGFSALFELANGGNNSLIFQPSTGTAINENPSLATYEFDIPYTSLGIAAGDTVDFVVVYANHDSPAYISNEGFPFPGNGGAGGDNHGSGAVTFTEFHRLNTIPEPSMLGAFLLAGAALLRRKTN